MLGCMSQTVRPRKDEDLQSLLRKYGSESRSSRTTLSSPWTTSPRSAGQGFLGYPAPNLGLRPLVPYRTSLPSDVQAVPMMAEGSSTSQSLDHQQTTSKPMVFPLDKQSPDPSDADKLHEVVSEKGSSASSQDLEAAYAFDSQAMEVVNAAAQAAAAVTQHKKKTSVNSVSAKETKSEDRLPCQATKGLSKLGKDTSSLLDSFGNGQPVRLATSNSVKEASKSGPKTAALWKPNGLLLSPRSAQARKRGDTPVPVGKRAPAAMWITS